MGIGLIIGIVALGAAAYFGLLSVMLNVLISPLYGRRSVFRRSMLSGDETRFDVTPARPSRGALVALVVGLLLIYLVPDFWIVGVVPLVIGLMVLSVGARYRKRSSITFAQDQLVAGKRKWALADIVGVNVRAGSSFNTDDPGQAIYTTPVGGQVLGGKSSSVLFSKALARRVVERSYLLTLRTRQGSKEDVLAGGLSLDCAKSLRDDLASEVTRRGNASL